MRYYVVIFLVLGLVACGTSPKDYSSATELQSVESQLTITPIWAIQTGGVPNYAHAQLPPAISGSSVYVASINGKILALDIDKGRKMWSTRVKDIIAGGPGFGDGHVFVSNSKAEIISLSRQDGVEQWRTKVSSEMLSTPLYSDGSLYVQTIDGKITSIDANTGKINWVYTHDTPRLTLRGTASPIMVGDQIISGFADGKLVSIGAKKGELLWSTTIVTPMGRTDLEKLSDIDGVIQSNGNTVFVVGYQGRVAAISATDGSIQWSRKLSSYSGLTYNNGHIYISDVDSNVWALDAHTGATLWRQEGLVAREISTPEVIGHAVVVADFDGYVHWLSEEDGRFIARQNLGDVWESYNPSYFETLGEELDSQRYHRIVSIKPSAANNILLVRDNEGALIAFRVEG